MRKAELVQMAAAAGLPRLSDKHLDQLQKSLASARELADKLPKDLHWSEELALTFRLPGPRATCPRVSPKSEPQE
jgi:hypothetical protein